MSEQIIPFGGTVEVSSDGSTYQEVPEAKSIPVPQTSQEYPEVTSLDSPGGFREYLAGLKDAGELSFQAGYTSAGYTLIDGLEGVNAYWRVTFPLAAGQSTTGDVFTFRGFPTPAVDAGDVGAPVNMDVTVRVTGQPTFAAGA